MFNRILNEKGEKVKLRINFGSFCEQFFPCTFILIADFQSDISVADSMKEQILV